MRAWFDNSSTWVMAPKRRNCRRATTLVADLTMAFPSADRICSQTAGGYTPRPPSGRQCSTSSAVPSLRNSRSKRGQSLTRPLASTKHLSCPQNFGICSPRIPNPSTVFHLIPHYSIFFQMQALKNDFLRLFSRNGVVSLHPVANVAQLVEQRFRKP